jgi:flavin-dependent dehydrogenase
VNAPSTSKYDYDVVIVGGALSGAATAIQLLRGRPDLRLLIVEKSTAFTRRVGEATVEISAYFLGRVLGLTQYLNEAHLIKQGMRFWFANEETSSLEDSSEIGGRYMARVPAYQVDRATLDEEVLRRAQALGAELWRPASVARVELNSGGSQSITVRRGEESQSISARWVVDASGLTALLSRQNGWWRANAEHPTTAVWARWKGVKDWDSLELAQKFPKWSMECHGVRNTATNHLVGQGWWAWCIPLKGGDVSVGIVFDQRLVEFPEGGALGQRLKTFLCQHPAGKEILCDADWVEGDVHWRKNLPYCSSCYAGDGFAIVGDAGAFLDPFYSPGMDWVSFTSVASAEIILAQFRGEPIGHLIEKHNRDFVRAYQRWFESVYKDKYFFMGDYELMRLAFLLDLGLYYVGVASQPFKRGPMALKEPVFSTPPSVPFYHLMRTYARRLAAMGESRRQRGVWGRHNRGRRFLFGGYTFAGKSSFPILQALAGWALLEVSEGWRTWFGFQIKSGPGEVQAKQPASKAAEQPAPVH